MSSSHRRWSQTTLAQPIFNFPREEPHIYTATDLINILKICKSTIAHEAKFKKPKPPLSKWDDPTSGLADMLDTFHSRPGNGHVRCIYRHWPRAPNGKHLLKINSHHGKMAPNQLPLWGSTILDFYTTHRIPGCAGKRTYSTSSKLLSWMKANGEVDCARDEIEWAELEDDPRLIEAWNPAEEIEEMEERIRSRKAGQAMPSRFKRSSKTLIYPKPWPMMPFSYPTERLTAIIDFANLPTTLIVHDPCNILAVKHRDPKLRKDDPWTLKPDRIVAYKLKLNSPKTNATPPPPDPFAPAQTTTTTATTEEEFIDEDAGKLKGIYIDPPTALGPVEPPIFVVYPVSPLSTHPLPPLNPPIEEAHLYLWPTHLIGEGHHSFVYHAEWELPRASLVPPLPSDYILCKKCIMEDVTRQLKELDGENGERKEEQWKQKTATVVKAYKGRRQATKFSVYTYEELNLPYPDRHNFIYEDPHSEPHLEYRGPHRTIRTSVTWQERLRPTCSHLTNRPEPPTAKVRVVAKLSLEGDDHLEHEAAVYQQFPKHLFEHWSGLNMVPPEHDPVPLAPVVPQFYGYYVPEDEDEEDDVDSDATPPRRARQGYFSPILLLEDCGTQVEVKGLTTDQRNEAVSLITRLHSAAWIHGSVYTRNFLSQPGPLHLPPAERSNKTPSFRLVDFGRSTEFNQADSAWRMERLGESSEIRKIFGIKIY